MALGVDVPFWPMVISTQGIFFGQPQWCCRMKHSLSRRGSCWNNASMEPLFRSQNWFRRCATRQKNEAAENIGFYLMDYYNWRVPHQYNKGVPPAITEN